MKKPKKKEERMKCSRLSTLLLVVILPALHVTAFQKNSLVFSQRPAGACSDASSCCRSLQQPGSADDASVGDYVKGVHGGKYQFEQAGAMGLAGREFAESLYAGSSSEEQQETDDENEPLPKWAERLRSVTLQDCQETLIIPSGKTVTVTIQNNERTWEPFHVVVNDDHGSLESSVIECSPRRGKLAPVGGKENPYNPSQPYLDSVKIQVKSCGKSGQCVLAMGTEEERWFYRVVVE